MKIKPIIIILGEPYSVFLEILFKLLKSKLLKSYRFPLVLIGSEKLVKLQMKKMNFFFKINLIKKDEILKNKLNNSKINIILLFYLCF